jgi:large subunit ribosomal protein L10
MKDSSNKLKKIDIVENLKKEVAESHASLVLNYQGLSVENINTLRGEISALGSKMQAVKKTLLRLVFASQEKLKELSQKEMLGQVAIVLIKDKPLETIKAIKKFADSFGKPDFQTGFFEGKAIEKADFLTLSAIPSQEILRGRAVGLIKNPINRFILNLKGNEQKLVLVLKALAEKKS